MSYYWPNRWLNFKIVIQQRKYFIFHYIGVLYHYLKATSKRLNDSKRNKPEQAEVTHSKLQWKNIPSPSIDVYAQLINSQSNTNIAHTPDLKKLFSHLPSLQKQRAFQNQSNLEGWEEGSRGREHLYTYGWFTLLYGRTQHNIVKQLFSKLKKQYVRLLINAI